MKFPDWIERAKRVDAVTVDMGFLISESFFYGPENGFTPEQWKELREPLYQPNLPRYGDFLLSIELNESVAEMVRYYRDVLDLANRHGKQVQQNSPYFWMRPLIFARNEFAITFPWHDTWNDALPVLQALATSGDGLLVDDVDQGWEFHAFAQRDRLYLRQGDFDTGEEHVVISVDRAQLAGQVPTVVERVERLLPQLSAALGRDYWLHN